MAKKEEETQLRTRTIILPTREEGGRRFGVNMPGERFGALPAVADELVRKGAAKYAYTEDEQLKLQKASSEARRKAKAPSTQQQIAELTALVREQQRQIDALQGAKK